MVPIEDRDKNITSLQLESEEPLLPQWHRVQQAVCSLNGVLAWACCSTFLLFVAGSTLAMAAVQRKPLLLYNCLYALGGGEVVDGNFPQPRIVSQECRKTYQEYFAGPYSQDVNLAISSAAAYFSNLHEGNRSQVVVFDIDETALSNLPEWQQYQLAGVIEDAAARSARQQQANSPALIPTRSLYNELYRKGFSVTFLTGRHEGQNSRNLTADNLETAGYGRPCLDSASDSQPCYLQLDMREDNDTRLASIYKPDRRAQLEARGYTVVGSFGDQWSDLAGTAPAVASFKLPNPMYYIL